jgi:hypothetical protein
MPKFSINLPTKIAISVIIIALLLIKMDFAVLKQAGQTIQASAWMYAFILICAQMFLQSLRWMLLINIGRHRMNFMDSLKTTLISAVANMAIISTLGGAVVRVAMALQHGASLMKALFATMTDRIMTLAALILMATIFLPSLTVYVTPVFHRDVSIFIGVLVLLLFILTPLIVVFAAKRMPHINISKKHIAAAMRYMKILFSNNVLLTKILTVSLLAQLCFFAAVYCIIVSAGIPLSFLQVMIVLPVIALISSLPFTLGGWGIREGAFIYGLGLLGVPMETAFTVSVQIGLVGLLTTIIVGLPAFFTSHFSPFKAKSGYNEAS